MELKSLLKLINLKKLLIVLFAPISLGIIDAFYKYDVLNIYLLISACTIILFGISISSLQVLSLYRRGFAEQLPRRKEGIGQVSWGTVRIVAYTTLAMGIVTLGMLYLIAGLNVIIPFIISFVLFLFYALGPKPLWQTPLNEVIFSFGIGYLLLLFETYSAVFPQVTNVFSFYVEILWVSLPVVLALFCVQFVNNRRLMMYDNQWLTMTSLMDQKTLHTVMEIATFLACLLPTIAIYLNNMPWTIILIWIMYPKMVINLRKYQETNNYLQKHHYIIQNAEIIIVFQVLLMIFGVFF